MEYHHPPQIIGFHSCDKHVGLDVINGKQNLNPSNNSWDWLGNGIYFWEYNPARALKYAMDSARGVQYNKIRIQIPFVIGAIIDLGRCLNLLETDSLQLIKESYSQLEKANSLLNKPMPTNEGAKRRLDCSVIKYLHKLTKDSNYLPYDTVRSAFHEEDFLYNTANFTSNLHIEVCVINPEMIKGYFLPTPVDKYNPYLNKAFIKGDVQS